MLTSGAAEPPPILCDTTLQIEQSWVSCVVAWLWDAAAVTSEINASAVINATSAHQLRALNFQGSRKAVTAIESVSLASMASKIRSE